MTTRLYASPDGRRAWSLTRDAEGHREYKLKTLVEVVPASSGVYAGKYRDGPFTALNTPGLPAVGSTWAFGNDLDIWAYCRNNAVVTEHESKEGEHTAFYIVEQTFSTKPDKRCNNTNIEDPLLEPQKISGSFVKDKKEATQDRYGDPITNSAHEQIRGPQNEWDDLSPTVHIEQNVAVLNLPLLARMRNRVNNAPLWGMPARCIKLSGVSWRENFYGTCYKYYTRIFDFEVNEDTFDRDLLDEGTNVLKGHWNTTTGAWTLDNINGSAPDPNNPAHFIRAVDPHGNLIRVVLNGAGVPVTTDPGTGTGTGPGGPGTIHVEKYYEDNLLLLGIPTVLG